MEAYLSLWTASPFVEFERCDLIKRIRIYHTFTTFPASFWKAFSILNSLLLQTKSYKNVIFCWENIKALPLQQNSPRNGQIQKKTHLPKERLNFYKTSPWGAFKPRLMLDVRIFLNNFLALNVKMYSIQKSDHVLVKCFVQQEFLTEHK